MKFVMILMMKNEEKILKRCLEAVESIVDGYCILDTGSTDSSKQIAEDFLKNRVGCVTQDPFRDFGYSRTKSFENAQKYLKENTDWDLTQTYGLLLDADMVFVPGTLKQEKLTAVGYSLIQKNGGMEYYNARLVRMDHPWNCVSVTHEYWNGPTEKLGKNICFIDDKNDGGCKSDKFERDKRLLEQGIVDEPDNVRYMFYLAQTYKCLGEFKNSIMMYEKRVEAGGWPEEVYYSLFMIGECYLNLKDIFNFERYMQMAYNYRPCRGETIYKLAEFYRVVGEHYKSYHYIQLGRKIPFPKDDVLFIETPVYEYLFDYEASIVEYYIHRDRGLLSSMVTMIKTLEHQQNILSNLKHYVSPIGTDVSSIQVPPVFGEDFKPSAISIDEYPYANVRFVNYWIDNGVYKTKDNVAVQTQNAYMNIETGKLLQKMEDSSIGLPRFDTHVKGLEDIRLYKNDGKLKFTATSVREYAENKVCVVYGDYDKVVGKFYNVSVLNSPRNRDCEKNWLPIPETNKFIYGWYPYEIGEVQDGNFKIVRHSPSPSIFSLFRGSAPPVKTDNGYLAMVHIVEYAQVRNYYHLFVNMDNDFTPVRISTPFIFFAQTIEYCVSFRLVSNSVAECYFSNADSNPKSCKINLDQKQLTWFQFSPN